MLRNPMLRVRSAYDFEKKQKADTRGARFAKKASIKEYVRWRMQADVPPTIRNMQVKYLTRNSGLGSVNMSRQHLAEAKDFVQLNPLVGIVEFFQNSMTVFSSHFKRRGLRFDFTYEKQNVTSPEEGATEVKLSKLQHDLGDALYQEVLEKNELDMQLYEYASEVLLSRLHRLECN